MTLNEFKDKYLGKQVEYHSYSANAENQCVDLINQYLTELLHLSPIIGTNAKDFKNNFNPNELDWIPNTPDGIPRPGDIIVWNGRMGGGAGHVAINLNSTINTITSLDQNFSRKEYVTIENHSYTNVSGWLRPKGKDMTDKIEIETKKFEELVTKASKYDAFYNEGYSDPAEITRNMEEYKRQIKQLHTEKNNALSDVEEYRKRVNDLIAYTAKALDVRQDETEVRTAIDQLSDQVGQLEDLTTELEELKVISAKEKQELKDEIAVLKAKLELSNPLDKYTALELLQELLKRFTKILSRN